RTWRGHAPGTGMPSLRTRPAATTKPSARPPPHREHRCDRRKWEGSEMTRLSHAALWALGACALLASTPVLTGSSQAPAVYFVIADGDDAGAGTEQSPWRTIQRCVGQLAPGDTCMIGAGSFAEAVVVARSGSSGSPIRVIGQSGDRTTIAGSLSITGDHVVVEDMRVDMPAGATWGLRLYGHSGVASGMHVTTTSDSLGMNNLAAAVSGSGNTLTRSRLERTCFGVS